MLPKSMMLLALAAIPLAPVMAEGGKPPQRVRTVLLKPGESCPKSSNDEIVVCGQQDRDSYRIPKTLRSPRKQTPANTAWAVRAERVMADARKTLPNSCSAIGTNGQTGCTQQWIENWSAEQTAKRNGQTTDETPQ